MNRWRSVIGLRWKPRKLTLRRKRLVALRVYTPIRWVTRTRGWTVVDVTPWLSQTFTFQHQKHDADATKQRKMTQILV